MAISVNIVKAFGVRYPLTGAWIPIDGLGTTGSTSDQEDTSKFKGATFCNTSNDNAIIISIKVFHRSTFAANASTYNPVSGNIGLFLIYKQVIPIGATFEFNETYIDHLKTFDSTQDPTSVASDEPIIAVWKDTSENPEVDIIIRR